jgi:hypothetical protein
VTAIDDPVDPYAGEPDSPPHPAETTAGDAGLTPVDLDESLQPVDLAAVLAGNASQPIPSQLLRDDGKALFYEAAINGVHADSGVGKGWLGALLTLQGSRVGRRTLIVDLEDTAQSWTGRLTALGMTPDDILRSVVYVRPQVPLGPASTAHLVQLIADRNISNVILDSLGEAFGLAGIDENKDTDVGPWLRIVARPLADTGAMVLVVDHATKAADNPLHPSGSKRKRAAITGASYLLEAIKPFVKGDGGRLRLTCAKDRHGSYRRGEAVADLVMVSGTSSVDLSLYAPTAGSGASATVPAILAARAAVAAAKTAGRPVTQNELLGLMKNTIKAGSTVKRGGIDYAAAEGALTETAGRRGARVFTFAQDLEDPDG